MTASTGKFHHYGTPPGLQRTVKDVAIFPGNAPCGKTSQSRRLCRWWNAPHKHPAVPELIGVICHDRPLFRSRPDSGGLSPPEQFKRNATMTASTEKFHHNGTTAQRHDGSGLATEITEATETEESSLFDRGLRGCRAVVCKPAICVRITPP